MKKLLGVNIDHVATLREARKTTKPDPVIAAGLALEAGGDGITVHLRHDRRHIQDRDLQILRQVVPGHLNLEMGLDEEIANLALKTLPDMCTLVPESAGEVTTLGGLSLERPVFDRIQHLTMNLRVAGIAVSLFIEPELEAVRKAADTGATHIEIHTGLYAELSAKQINHCETAEELEKIAAAAALADRLGLIVNAGHGLDYRNTLEVALIPEIRELNIGHSIMARSILYGLADSVAKMRAILNQAEVMTCVE